MQIRRFYHSDLSPDSIILSAEESFHALKVLRLAAGDAMLLLDGKGTVAEAELTGTTGSRRQQQAVCRIAARKFFPLPETGRIHLYVAPPKGKNFDLILKSATELGVHRIIPVLCRYGVVRPGEKTENYRQVLITACKQCCNPWLPEISAAADFQEAVANVCPCGCFGASPTHPDIGRLSEQNWTQTAELAAWVGPEGGFDPEEEKILARAGMQPVTVGRWTLRVETAVPALLGYLHGKMHN